MFDELILTRVAIRRVFYLATFAAIAAPHSFAIARSVQLVVQPSADQATGMTHGVQIVVSAGSSTEIRMMTPEPGENNRVQLAFLFVNRSSQAINVGPENVTTTLLSLVSYDQLIEEQRHHEGRKKFGNFLFKLGNALSAADAGNEYSSFNYSGNYSGSGFSGGNFVSGSGTVSGGGTITTYNPYLARQAQAQVREENIARTESMYQSFADTRSSLGRNLRTTTVMPQHQIQGVLTFDMPRSLQRASTSQQFTITIQMGSDRHVLNGFVGPVGTLPPIAPSVIAVMNANVAQSPAVTDLPNHAVMARMEPVVARDDASARPQQATRPTSTVAPVGKLAASTESVSIEAFRRGDYIGRPAQIAALAKQGYAPAQYELGGLYQNGKGVAQNNAQAVRLYGAAAAQGFRDAQSSLAWMYENGQGVRKNIATARHYYSLAAENGDRSASSRLIALQTGQ